MLLIVVATNIYAQDSVPILITGHINYNGKPVGTDIRIVDENGDSYKVKANSTDGSYQQSLKSGQKYHIFFNNYLIENGNNSIDIAPTSEYKEFTFNYNLIKVDAGYQVFKSIGFEKNKSTLTKEGIQYLKDLKELAKSQNSVIYFDIVISTQDSDFKPKKEKVSEIVKGKTKLKNVTISVIDQSKRLYEEREKVLIDKLNELKINKRNCNIIYDNSVLTTNNTKIKSSNKSKVQSITPIYTLIAKINKVTNL